MIVTANHEHKAMTWPCLDSACRLLLAAMVAATLASCGGGELAGPDADRDGQTLAAKPEMARLYLISGYTTVGTPTHPSGEPIAGSQTVYYYDTPDGKGPTGMVVMATLLAGPLAGLNVAALAAEDAERVDRPKREKPIAFGYKLFIDDKYVGDLGAKQYVALDLLPGTYTVFFKPAADPSSVLSLELKPGDVEFFLTNIGQYMGSYWEKCGAEDCAPLIRDGHRVTVDLAGRQEYDGPYRVPPREKADNR
jgi:hypothetical protein